MATAPATPRAEPRLSRPRLLAGAFAGGVGGLAFGLVMTAELMRDLQGHGMSALVARVLGTGNLLAVWGAHLVAAAIFGLVFAALVAPRRPGRVALAAMLYAAVLWGLGAFLALRTLAGEPLVLDADALGDLAGHLLFGATLGVTYLAFFREEGRLAWARRPRRATL